MLPQNEQDMINFTGFVIFLVMQETHKLVAPLWSYDDPNDAICLIKAAVFPSAKFTFAQCDSAKLTVEAT